MTSAARARDRRVYLSSHPVLFALLAALRGRPVRRIGRTLVVHDREDYLAALTRIPLDRTAEGTTGGAVDRLAGPGGLFDQQGDDHRRTRRDVADRLGAAGVERLRPLWTGLLEERLAPLAAGGTVDLVPLATEIAGATAAALLDLEVDPFELAAAAREAGATAARAHLPGFGRRRADSRAETAAERLISLLAPGGERTGRADAGLAATLAVAAVNTTIAVLPRAAAWASADDLWAYAQDPLLADELLRVTAPTPLLPRVAAADGELAGGCPVHAGDRLLLIARHAAEAHRRDPDPARPAPARTSQLVFGAGPHACPGARLARQQLTDLLAALAPHRPVVVRARADRRSALPGWRVLTLRASHPAQTPAAPPALSTTTPIPEPTVSATTSASAPTPSAPTHHTTPPANTPTLPTAAPAPTPPDPATTRTPTHHTTPPAHTPALPLAAPAPTPPELATTRTPTHHTTPPAHTPTLPLAAPAPTPPELATTRTPTHHTTPPAHTPTRSLAAPASAPTEPAATPNAAPTLSAATAALARTSAVRGQDGSAPGGCPVSGRGD